MSLLKSIVDNIGDVLGTSKLEKLNRAVFRPLLGTEITRQEYEMCDGANLIPLPDKRERLELTMLKDHKRISLANGILETMVDNGTVFSDNRISTLVAAQQDRVGVNNLSYKVMRQMSDAGRGELDFAISNQKKTAQIRGLQLQ